MSVREKILKYSKLKSGRYGRRDNHSSDEENDRNRYKYSRGFLGFASQETICFKKILMLEKEVDKWIDKIREGCGGSTR